MDHKRELDLVTTFNWQLALHLLLVLACGLYYSLQPPLWNPLHACCTSYLKCKHTFCLNWTLPTNPIPRLKGWLLWIECWLLAMCSIPYPSQRYPIPSNPVHLKHHGATSIWDGALYWNQPAVVVNDLYWADNYSRENIIRMVFWGMQVPAEKRSCSRSLSSNLPSLSPPFCLPAINLLLSS